MKTIKFFFLAVFAGMMFVSCNQTNCEDCNHGTPQVSNVTFTECNNEMPTNRADNNVVVVFTNAGVNITHYGLVVNCAFDTVIINQIFENGVLTITERGEPNYANCICHTDVSYTISGISQNNVDSIVINGEVVWTANGQNTPTFEGAWCGTFGAYEGDFTIPSLVFGDTACITFSGNTYQGVNSNERFAHPAFCSAGTYSINGDSIMFNNAMFTPTDWCSYFALNGNYTFTLINNVLTIKKNSSGLGGYFIYILTKQN